MTKNPSRKIEHFENNKKTNAKKIIFRNPVGKNVRHGKKKNENSVKKSKKTCPCRNLMI